MTTETQQYRAGDRVRVVLEGEVTARNATTGSFYVASNFINPGMSHVVSIEKLLPTTPGSVVVDGDVYFFTLQADGLWYGRMGIGMAPVGLGDCAVVFDAGAGK